MKQLQNTVTGGDNLATIVTDNAAWDITAIKAIQILFIAQRVSHTTLVGGMIRVTKN
ncbi:MAG: hypothetical protein QNK99_09180 [Burkholderiales bacterium]